MTPDLANNSTQQQALSSEPQIPLAPVANAALARLDDVINTLAPVSRLSIDDDGFDVLANSQLRLDAIFARNAISAGVAMASTPATSRASAPGVNLVFGGMAMAALVARKAARVKDMQERETPMKKARGLALAIKARRRHKRRHGAHSHESDLDDESILGDHASAFSALPRMAPTGLAEMGLDGELAKELVLLLGDLHAAKPSPAPEPAIDSSLADLSIEKILARRVEPKPYDPTTSPFFLKMPTLEYNPRS